MINLFTSFTAKVLVSSFFTLCLLACEQDEDLVIAPDAEFVSIDKAITNDSLWQADSAKMINMMENLWDVSGKYPDSTNYYANQLIETGEKLLEYKFDSIIFIDYAMAFGSLGSSYERRGKLDQALEMTLKSFDLVSEKFGEKHIVNPMICVNISKNYVQRGDYELAIEWQKKGLDITRQLFPDGNHHFFQNILRNIGTYYQQSENLTSAIEYFLEAEQASFRHPGNNFLQFYTRFRIVNAYREMNNFNQAMKYLNLMDSVIYKDQLIETLWKVTHGQVLKDSGQLSEAAACFADCLPLYDNLPFSVYYLDSPYKELGDIELLNNRPLLAKEYYEQAIKKLIDFKQAKTGNIIEIKNSVTHSLMEAGLHQDAVVNAQQTLNSYSSSFDKSDFYKNAPINALYPDMNILKAIEIKADALYLLYGKEKNEQLLTACNNTYLLAAQLVDKMRYSYKKAGSKNILSERALNIFEGATKTSLELHQLSSNELTKEEAFKQIEKSKAFTLHEKLGSALPETYSGISKEILQQKKKIGQDIFVYENLINEEKIKQENIDTSKMNYWSSRLVDLIRQKDLIESDIKNKYPEYYQLLHGLQTVSPTQIQKGLAKNETLIEYFLGDTTLYTFTISKSDFNVHQQKIDSTFYITAGRLQHTVQQRGSDVTWQEDFRQFVSDSRYLYDLLIAPSLRNAPTTNRLIIIPDGVLNFLPFNLLLTADPAPVVLADSDYRQLPYLLNGQNIRYEYSATLMAENLNGKSLWGKILPEKPTYYGFAPAYHEGEILASRGDQDSLKLTTLYPEIFRGELGALAHNRPEVEAAAQYVGGTPLTGQQATERTFKELAPRAGILHLAMHAFTNDQEPMFSQLAFEPDEQDTAEDGRLHAYELYNMRLGANLAVLSACNTGAGKLQRGEGVMSLSRAFKYAGVPNVVMSLWKASDEPTKNIISDFFRHLKTGMGKDRALCEAQRTYLQKANKFDGHPHHWATMVLIGDGEAVWQEGSALIYLLFLIIGIFSIFALWYFRQRNRFG